MRHGLCSTSSRQVAKGEILATPAGNESLVIRIRRMISGMIPRSNIGCSKFNTQFEYIVQIFDEVWE
jgi:hypothetical protein